MRILLLILLSFFSYTLSAQLILWEDTLTAAKIYLRIPQEEFEEHKHRTSKAFDVIETDEKYHEAIINTFVKALRKYPSKLLDEHVEAIYVYDQFYKNHGALGTYLGRHGFFFQVGYIDSNIDSLNLERVIHHEISHRLLMFNPKSFDYKAWKNNNLMKYGAAYDSQLKIQEIDSALYSKGFVQAYGLTNKLEDFATFAENIFIYQADFWNAVQSHELIRNKFEIACAFYEGLDPSMNQQYFLNLHGLTLTNQKD